MKESGRKAMTGAGWGAGRWKWLNFFLNESGKRLQIKTPGQNCIGNGIKIGEYKC